MDVDLQKVPKYTPFSYSRNYEHSKKMRRETSRCVYICVNTEYSFLSSNTGPADAFFLYFVCCVNLHALMCTVFVKCVK